MKFLHIVGNRPQFIKLSPFLRASTGKAVENVIVHSGQHYDYEMSQVFFTQLDIPRPDYNLGAGSGSHGFQTGRMLVDLDPILMKENPDFVIVYGDTNTTLAGALAAYKLHIRVAHVESGMREYIWRPEEMNKKMADHCSDYCFCPLQRACDNLAREGISPDKIFNTGDITYDAFLFCKAVIESGFENDHVDGEYALMTMHRAETVDSISKVAAIVEAIVKLPIQVIYPVHPRTEKKLREFGLFEMLEKAKNVILKPPVGYFEFNSLLTRASLVITDSSGVLKEAYYAQRLCVTIDETTEYGEIFDEGCNVLVGFKRDNIVKAVGDMLSKKFIDLNSHIFGTGHAAEQMVSILLQG
jgi:UDP-N-acetylglucosamine 2-epimerase